MGSEISVCCTQLQQDMQHELDKRNVKDFRYLSRHEGKMVQTEGRFQLKAEEELPEAQNSNKSKLYSLHLRKMEGGDPYAQSVPYHPRGDSIFVIKKGEKTIPSVELPKNNTLPK